LLGSYENLWYRVIRKTLLKQFECDIESEDFSNQNPFELAQKLINNPISDAFDALSNGFGESEGDEE
jgi:hypothetical protein